MISTQAASDVTSTDTVRIKTLNSHQVRSEQKDLEIEEEEPANNDIAVDEHESVEEQEIPTEPEIFAEHEIQTGLSTRASALKEYLQDTTEAKAIILKADGSSDEISFSASSVETRSLLSSRPSIIGEIEDLQIVVVKALDSSNDASKNKHTLPVPLCHEKSGGDYVLFRVDSAGKVVDLSLSEYQKYVEAHKTLTETAMKQYSSANEQIKSHSPFGSDSKRAMESLRGALETKLRSQLQSEEESKQSDADIRGAVNKELQKLVDAAVSALESSPMVDPDYNPEEDVEMESQSDHESTVDEEVEVEALDTRPWRAQLEDALKHVADLGRVDGEDFAEMICNTFCELNGSEPSLKQLTSLYSQIRADFANEAEEELDDESSAEEESETEEEEEEVIESEVDEEEEGLDGDEWEHALDNIRRLGRADGRALAERVCDVFYEGNGEEPTLEELSSVWQSIQDEFAAEAQEEVDLDEEEEEEEESDIDEEVSHQDRGTMVEMTPLESLEFATKTIGADWVSRANSLFWSQKGQEPDEEELVDTIRAFAVEMADTVLSSHFGFEGDLEDDVDMESVEEQGVDSDYDPENLVDRTQAVLDEGDELLEMESGEEQEQEQEGGDSDYNPENAMDQAQAQRDALEDQQHGHDHFELSMLNTPVVTSKRGGGVSWDVFFDENDLNEEAESSNLEKSIDGFKMMNRREPTHSEVAKMKQFLSVPVEVCDEQSMAVETSSAVIQTPIISSKQGGVVSWTVYFGQSNGAMERAVSSFKRVYQREPSSLELDHLRSFMNGSAQRDRHSVSTMPSMAPSKVLVSPVAQKKTAKRFNVYLEDSKLSQRETEEIAIKWFKRFNKREPNEQDLVQIRAFIQKEADLKEQEFLVPVKSLKFEDGDDDDVKESEVAVLSTTTRGIVTKSGATGYTIDFDDDEKRGTGDEEQAVQWFKRFNNRDPSKEEAQNIKQFVKTDEDDMIDIE